MRRRLGEAGGGTGVAVRAAQYQKNDGSVRLCSTYYNHLERANKGLDDILRGSSSGGDSVMVARRKYLM